MKLFKLGRLHGTLDLANIQVTGSCRSASQNLGTFGFDLDGDPGEFRLPGVERVDSTPVLPPGLRLQAQQLSGEGVPGAEPSARLHADGELLLAGDGQVRPGRHRPGDATPAAPERRRPGGVGDQIRYVEFTNQGAVAQIVLIDQLEFKSFSRPNIEDDFGGYITLRLRTTEHWSTTSAPEALRERSLRARA
jgi:hypothetical protein